MRSERESRSAEDSHGTHSGLGPTLVRNVAFTAVARALSIAGWIAITPYVVSRLGPDRFGFWSLVSTFAGLSLTLDFGLSAAVTRFVARQRAIDDSDAMRGTLTLGLLASTALAAIWLVVVLAAPRPLLDFARVPFALRTEATATMAIAGIAFAFNLFALVPAAALAGFQRLDLAQRNLLVATMVQLAATVVALAAGGGLRELALISCVASLVSFALGWWSMRSLWPGVALEWPPPAGELRAMFGRYGVALQVVNLGVIAQYQLPKLFFARFLSLAAVGQYELGWRVAFSAWSVPTLLLPPLLPAASHLDAVGDRERLLSLHRRASRYLLPVAFTIAFGLVALSGVVFTAWLGPGHGDAARAHAAIAGLLGFNVLTSAGSLIYRGTGRPWIEAQYHALSFAIQLTAGLLLVPRWGFTGGLVAMLLSGTVGTIVFVIRFHRTFGEPLGRSLRNVVGRPACAAIVGAAVAWLVSGAAFDDVSAWTRGRALAGMLAGGAALVAVSGSLLFATGALTWAELRGLAGWLRSPAPPQAGA